MHGLIFFLTQQGSQAEMNTFQVHSQLAHAVRAASAIRHELLMMSRRRKLFLRTVLYLRLVYLDAQIETLIRRLRHR